MNIIKTRIAALRQQMAAVGIDACYISGTDPHSSEYLPERWQTRAFISGFTGSYGIVVVTADQAGLWTDTRYFLQAKSQLLDTGIKMFRLRVPDAVSPEDWLAVTLKPGNLVGIDPQTISPAAFREMETKFLKKQINLVCTDDLLDRIWENRPELPSNPVIEHELKYCGLSRKDKFELIEEKLANIGADFQVITTLDDLAWTFNLRGADVAFNPVFVGFGLIGNTRKVLFTGENKIPESIRKILIAEGLEILPYQQFLSFMKELERVKILIDPSSSNHAIYQALNGRCEIVEGNSIPTHLKAVKNKVELDGFRSTMRKDGAALVKFLYWLQNSLGKTKITEFTIGRKLGEIRSENEGFAGESFPPIVGYRDHGALVHFIVNEDNAYEIESKGLLLFDSGGHYFEGTTDITRTVTLGEITEQQRTDFTLVLKGMIALTLAEFPAGTKGCNLDILARKALWEKGLNYGHGTGHGVGHFLNVHEGPMGIRQEYNANPIEPGMVLSNEPALYREGEYGIRTENMMVCVEKEVNLFGRFLGFDTLTLCPIDTLALNPELLTREELKWINDYHSRVRTELMPFLPDYLKEYLYKITKPV